MNVKFPPTEILTDSAAVLLGAIKATVYDPNLPTVATKYDDDGTFTLIVGPPWLTATDPQRVAYLEHEAGHIVGQYHKRSEGYDALVSDGTQLVLLFNVCHDAVIHHCNPGIVNQIPGAVTFENLDLPPCPAEVAYEWLLKRGTSVACGGCGREKVGDRGESNLTDEQQAEAAQLAVALSGTMSLNGRGGTNHGQGRKLPDDAICPPWVRHMVAWLDAWDPEDSRQRSYARESRRASEDILLPGMRHEPGASVQVNVDGSGSMPDTAMALVCAALRTPDLSMSIMRAFDVEPRPPVHVSDGIEAVKRAIAETGGGTAFKPVAAASASDPRRVVWITDGQSCDGWPEPHPAGELWLCTTDHVPPAGPGRVVVRIE